MLSSYEADGKIHIHFAKMQNGASILASDCHVFPQNLLSEITYSHSVSEVKWKIQISVHFYYETSYYNSYFNTETFKFICF